jgi:hypothetical protein
MAGARGGGPEGEGALAPRRRVILDSPRRGAPARGGSAARILAALALALILGGCGIEEYLYFYPPTLNSSVTSINPLSINHNTSNNSTYFLGYDVYYLLIDKANEAFLGSCYTKIDQYIGSGAKTPSELIPIIKSLGFKPLAGFDSADIALTTIPLVFIAQGGVSLDIDFDININAEGTFSVSGGGASYVACPAYVRRSSKDNAGNVRSFDNLTEDDVADDGDTAYLTPQPDTVLFRGYIFAHGTTASWGDVFSYPVLIGTSSDPIVYGTYE